MAHGTANSGVIEHGGKFNPPLANDEKMKRMREIDQVILHSTATNPSWYSDRSAENVVKEIRRGMSKKENGVISVIIKSSIVTEILQKVLLLIEQGRTAGVPTSTH